MTVDVSPDNNLIAYGSVRSICIYDLRSRIERIMQEYTGEKAGSQSVKFSPNGESLASGGREGLLRIWSMTTGGLSRTLTFSNEPGFGKMIRSVAWSSDGKMILASGDSGKVTVWDVSSEAVIGRFEGYKQYSSFRALFSPDDKLVYASQGDGSIRAWDVGTGKEVWSVDAQGSVWEIALCENGKSLLSSHIDGSVILWDLRTKREKQRMRLRGAWLRTGSVVGSMSITGDGERAVFPSSMGYIELWDLKNWSMLECFKAHPGETTIWETSVSHDGKWFATAGGDGTVRLWRFH